MKRLITILALLVSVAGIAGNKNIVKLWPKGKMPDAQPHQIAAMTDVSRAEGFNPDKWREPYLEWYEAPANPNGCCMILISGGGYNSCCDVSHVQNWREFYTAAGFQCVNFVYRTPRSKGIEYYQAAWDDGQRAVRLVRKEASKRGFDPEKIGTVSMSAGSHLALLLGSSSQTPAYAPVDKDDAIPCHINWALLHAPAYVTTDAVGTRASRDGYGPDVTISPIFKFDEKTCPMCFLHGGNDIYSPNGSTLAYRELRRRGIPAEVHIYPDKPHGVFGEPRALEFLTQLGICGPLAPEEKLLDRIAADVPGVKYEKEAIWPEGKMPCRQEKQCEPYLEWHIPAVLKTKAIQIIYSGGAYKHNEPDSFEVAPARRYLNEKGMAVVTVKYRCPRPEGLPKHLTAWQDLQRAIRIVRSEAASRGLDPDRIGIMGSSAGGHLTLMGVTSSLHASYSPIDELDKLSCSVQWGIGIYPAYALTDGLNGHNKTKGNDDSAVLSPEFSFDLKTAPMLFIHGDADGYSSMASVKCWEKMRAMGIQSELHTLALRPHCFHRECSPGTGSYTHLDRIWEFLTAKGFNR